MSSLYTNVNAQTKADTLDLGEITIESTRINKPALDQPVQVAKIDSGHIALQTGLDLGDMLSRFSSLYIRNNGPGAASVISQRGFGGEQTRVLWEGMPINHEMLGVTDLSLLPANTFSEVEVTSGSGSSLFGSGISGTVFLKNDQKADRISVGQSIGSFGNYITNSFASARSGNFLLSVNASTQSNKNDFRYYDQNSGSIEVRERGSFENDQVMGSIGWKKGKVQAKSSLWWSRADHEITENIFSGPGSAAQYDKSLRWVNNLKIHTEKFLWEGRVYASSTQLDYFNPTVNIESLSESNQASSEITGTYFYNDKTEIRGNISGTLTEVETNNYSEIKGRRQLGTGVSASLNPFSRLKLYPALRFDYYNDFGEALSPSLGLNYAIIKDELSIRGSVARNFRAPTFNDLYWPDGGNEDLEAERGFKSEIGFNHELKGEVNFSQQFSVYFIQLDNGIKWLPDTGGDFRAQNIQEITSKGMEWSGSVSGRIGKWKLAADQNISYTRAYISEERFRNDQAAGNQLPYVPYWKSSTSLQAEISGFSAIINGIFIDERFTTEQENINTAADEYFVLDASANYRINFSQTQLSVIAKANNLFNEQYSIVRFYPMPLRNFLIQITLTQQF
ncbi:MAG: TonB-dependent receptor [Gracilimonas sp.]